MSRDVIDDMNSVPEICKRHNKTMYWYGDWYCSECQKEEEWMEQVYLGKIYEKQRLCHKCYNSDWEDELEGTCIVYKMPISLVGRKNKCKRFEPFKEIWKDGYPIKVKIHKEEE